MARAQLVPISPSLEGTLVTYAAPTADGDAARPGTILHVKNAHTVPTVITLVTGGTVDGLAVADPTITVANATEKLIVIPGGVYPQTTGATKGQVHIDYSVIDAAITRVLVSHV